MKIGILDDRKNITGGEKYNTLFFKTMIEKHSCEVSYLGRTQYKKGISLAKIFAPIFELKYIKHLKKTDILFFSDTLAFRQILLLFFSRFIFRKKCITILHHYSFLFRFGIKAKLYKFFEKLFLNVCSDIIVVSPYTYDLTQKFYPNKSIFYIEIPFSNIFHDSETHRQGEILYVGTIEERKGLKLLIEALNILKHDNFNFKLKVVGKIVSECYYDQCKELIDKYQLSKNIQFLGRIDEQELETTYTNADFLVLPTRLEGYGIVINEAMSYGLPVIAFNNSAIPYTVKDKFNGLLVEDGSVSDLALKIKEFLNDRSFVEKLRNGAKDSIKEVNTLSNFVNQIDVFYETITVKK